MDNLLMHNFSKGKKQIFHCMISESSINFSNLFTYDFSSSFFLSFSSIIMIIIGYKAHRYLQNHYYAKFHVFKVICLALLIFAYYSLIISSNSSSSFFNSFNCSSIFSCKFFKVSYYFSFSFNDVFSLNIFCMLLIL